jgi:hypothetical protein
VIEGSIQARRDCPGRADSASDRLDNDYILKSDDRSIGRIWHHHQDAALVRLAGGDFNPRDRSSPWRTS